MPGLAGTTRGGSGVAVTWLRTSWVGWCGVAEVYLDDRLALCVSLLEKPRAGAAGCFVEGGACTFERFRMAELEPLRPLPVTPPA